MKFILLLLSLCTAVSASADDAGTDSVYVRGDVNLDGRADIADLAKLLGYVSGQLPNDNPMVADSSRYRIDLQFTYGSATDKTRVVINNLKSMDYELSCDAAKFSNLTATPVIYSVDGSTLYSINERPFSTGCVNLGYKAYESGTYTISTTRMETPMYIYDRTTDTFFNLSRGSYSFSSDAGTFNTRLVLVSKFCNQDLNFDGLTNIADVQLLKNLIINK